MNELLTCAIMLDSLLLVICDCADRIKGSVKSGTKVLICVGRLPQSYQNKLYQKQWLCVFYTFIALEIYCIEMHVCCVEMYVFCIYSRHIPYSSMHPLVV